VVESLWQSSSLKTHKRDKQLGTNLAHPHPLLVYEIRVSQEGVQKGQYQRLVSKLGLSSLQKMFFKTHPGDIMLDVLLTKCIRRSERGQL